MSLDEGTSTQVVGRGSVKGRSPSSGVLIGKPILDFLNSIFYVISGFISSRSPLIKLLRVPMGVHIIMIISNIVYTTVTSLPRPR